MEKENLWLHSRLIRNLNTGLDGADISHSISQLSCRVRKIESVCGPSPHTMRLRKEILELEGKLAYCVERANLRTKKFLEKTEH